MPSVGTTHTFTHTFTDILGNTLTTSDVTAWPKVIIRDRDGTIVVNGGIATATVNAGEYSYDYAIAMTAEAGTWSIEWQMVADSGAQAQYTETFEVEEALGVEDCGHEQTIIGRAGQTQRVMLSYSSQLSSVTVTATHPDENEAALTGTLGTEITEVRDTDGNYVYYYDLAIPATNAHGHWEIAWTYQETAASPFQYGISEVRVPPEWWWKTVASVQMALDKMQKSCGDCNIFSYGLSEQYEATARAIDYMNGFPPNGGSTNWSLYELDGQCGFSCARGRMSGPMYMYLISASVIHMLRAQLLMAGELAFDLSGQQVTLSSDKTGIYGQLLDIYTSEFAEHFPNAKRHCIRSNNAIGHLGVRPIHGRNAPRLMSRGSTINGPNGQLFSLVNSY